jgi:hypothetical protein
MTKKNTANGIPRLVNPLILLHLILIRTDHYLSFEVPRITARLFRVPGTIHSIEESSEM